MTVSDCLILAILIGLQHIICIYMSLGYESTFGEGAVEPNENNGDSNGQLAGGSDSTTTPGIAHTVVLGFI